jgi:hypothetical protein
MSSKRTALRMARLVAQWRITGELRSTPSHSRMDLLVLVPQAVGDPDGVVTDVEDVVTARALIATLRDELTKAQRENASLRHQLDVLCQRLFGKKSERVDPRQLQLVLE